MRKRTTIHWRTAGALRAIPTLLAAVLVVGGCSATHVGDAWQCPVAQGAACTSVAEADPAVASSEKARGLAIRGAPAQARIDDVDEAGPGCTGNCDFLVWLARWFSVPEETGERTAVPEAASVSPDGEVPDATDEGLRTKERIARIWIVPFVDAEGVYREGHWVRAVLEPARWRLR